MQSGKGGYLYFQTHTQTRPAGANNSLDIFSHNLMIVSLPTSVDLQDKAPLNLFIFGGGLYYPRTALTRICASLGLRMKFKTLFMGDHDLLIFFNMSNQFLALGV